MKTLGTVVMLMSFSVLTATVSFGFGLDVGRRSGHANALIQCQRGHR